MGRRGRGDADRPGRREGGFEGRHEREEFGRGGGRDPGGPGDQGNPGGGFRDRVDDRLDRVNERLDRLEERMERLAERLERGG